ncbi:glycosyltransferase [Candidatus Dojkabacteria bacterium]|nr:glycosyltransferase [Candidatus Dojkabacteria bacterium]
MPVHNGEKYLKEAIESVLCQTYAKLELIVVDDGSDDDTPAVLAEFAERDDRIKVKIVERQGQLGKVLNIGIRMSSGKYIARMDHDDVMLPGRLERQVKFMEENPDVVAVGGQVELIDSDGVATGIRNYALDDGMLKKNMFLYSPFAHPAVILRKDVLESVGLYPEDVKRVEDIKLWFIIGKKGKFANVPEVVLRYRVVEGSWSLENIVDQFRRVDEVRKWAVSELSYEVGFWVRFWWWLQRAGIRVIGLLPAKVGMTLFEVFRRFVR